MQNVEIRINDQSQSSKHGFFLASAERLLLQLGTHQLFHKFASPITNLSRRCLRVGGSLITDHQSLGIREQLPLRQISFQLWTINYPPSSRRRGTTADRSALPANSGAAPVVAGRADLSAVVPRLRDEGE